MTRESLTWPMHGDVVAELEGASDADVFRSGSRVKAQLLKMRGPSSEDAVVSSEEQAHWRQGHGTALPVATWCLDVLYQRSQNTWVPAVLTTGFRNPRTRLEHRFRQAIHPPSPLLLPPRPPLAFFPVPSALSTMTMLSVLADQNAATVCAGPFLL